MSSAFYLLALAALSLYVNVNTVTGPFPSRRERFQKNFFWYSWHVCLVASVVSFVLYLIFG